MYKFAGRVLNGEGFFVFVRVALRAPAAALSARTRSPAPLVRVTTHARRYRTSHNVEGGPRSHAPLGLYCVLPLAVTVCESGCVVCVPIFEFSTCTLRYDVLTSLTL